MRVLDKLIKKFTTKKLEALRKKEVVYSVVNRTPNHAKKIVYALPALRYPCGGNIVANNYVDVINALQYKGFTAAVLYAQEPSFNPTLFKYNSPLKTDLTFDPAKEFIIVPEIFALSNTRTLIENRIPYAISVLNGYIMELEMSIGFGDFTQLQRVYEQAAFIISVSDDTTANIKMAFPKCADKIIKAPYVIDKAKCIPLAQKKNTITYMPRKLARHSALVLHLLGDKLPKHWQLVPIDGVTEQEVYDIFTESKIFLSFSELEGLAMPPVMAAMSGNLVIGYSGEGNKEIMHLSCFEEVMCGDIKDFVEKLLKAVERFDQNQVEIDYQAIDYLSNKFSQHALDAFLKELMDHVDHALVRNA